MSSASDAKGLVVTHRPCRACGKQLEQPQSGPMKGLVITLCDTKCEAEWHKHYETFRSVAVRKWREAHPTKPTGRCACGKRELTPHPQGLVVNACGGPCSDLYHDRIETERAAAIKAYTESGGCVHTAVAEDV